MGKVTALAIVGSPLAPYQLLSTAPSVSTPPAGKVSVAPPGVALAVFRALMSACTVWPTAMELAGKARSSSGCKTDRYVGARTGRSARTRRVTRLSSDMGTDLSPEVLRAGRNV